MNYTLICLSQACLHKNIGFLNMLGEFHSNLQTVFTLSVGPYIQMDTCCVPVLTL